MNTYPRMHASLYVSNLENTVKFYSNFFGHEPAKLKPGYAKFILDKPSLIISFVAKPERVNSNFGHLGFQVESKDEMMDKLELAKSLDLATKEEIGTACCYALQDKFWVQDPDGHNWEVYYLHADSEFNDPEYALEDTKACCTKAQEVKPELALSEAESCCAPGSACC